MNFIEKNAKNLFAKIWWNLLMFYWKNDKSPGSPGLFLEPQAIHTENLAVSGDTSYNIGRMGRQNASSECF